MTYTLLLKNNESLRHTNFHTYKTIFQRRLRSYVAKELDAETGLYYYGARYLDPRTSRWLGVDPAMGEYVPIAGKENNNLPNGGVYNYTNLHTFHYSNNNPIKYTDPDGRAAGDEFDTMDGAAIDFANTYNDDSIRHGREYSSSIYQKDNGKYVYSVPNVGSSTGVSPSRESKHGGEEVATIHTHVDPMHMSFSPSQDIDEYMEEGIIGYLVTPFGDLQKYDPSKDDKSYNGWKDAVDFIYYDAPKLENYNQFPDNKINPRFPSDFFINWFPYIPPKN